MKTKILITLFCFFIYGAFAQSEEVKTIKLSVLSWNVQLLPNFFGVFSSSLRKMQHKRVPWIAAYLKARGPEVLILQEVFDVDCKRRLRRLLKEDYPYQQMPINQGRLTSNGIMILSKQPIQYLDHVVYPKGIGADKMAAKGCVLVQVEKEDQHFQIAGTHLQSGSSPEAQQHRNQQYKAIAQLLQKHYENGIPQILAGDMNTRKKARQDYQKMIQTMEVEDFPLNEKYPYTIDEQNYWKSENSEAKQLDYVFLRKNKANCTIINQKVIRPIANYKALQIDLADHYGVHSIIQYQK